MATENDKTMFNEETADITKAIMIAWDRAKALGITYDSFEKHVDEIVEGALGDCAD